MRLVKTVISSLVICIALSALSPARAQHENVHIIFITHGQEGDTFWDIVQRGIAQAEQDFDLDIDYRSPTNFDLAEMAGLIDAAVREKPDGLIVSIPDPVVLGPSIKRAIDAGIPVISINSGSDEAERLGVIAHIGQAEYDAGFGAGLKMAKAGAKNAICLNQEVGNIALDLRCQGFTDGMMESGGKVRVLAVEALDPTAAAERIANVLISDQTIDSVLALGPTSLTPMLDGGRASNRQDTILFGTFDLSPEILRSIQDGDILFAIDQQPYLQGYLPVAYMILYLENLNTPGDPFVLTGPSFVTIDNVDRVIQLSIAGTR
ncbi:MAG: sugar ABC transporter substrate-binding protein [Chloroflexi bacterium]|nr:sugar ABC transporter substrate-binding protein [Chloroflexota bacterium]